MWNRLFTAALLTFAALTVAGPAVWAETVTKTYLFSGGQGNSALDFWGYFYEEGSSGTPYYSSPRIWTYNSTGSVSFTLADGIGLTFASSINKIAVRDNINLTGEGDVTFTISGGSTYYIWHVIVYDRYDNTLFAETNMDDANVENTKSFSKTSEASTTGVTVKKMVITYSEQDRYLIDGSSTTISGVDYEYQYLGSPVCPEPVVVCNGRTLDKNYHYTVEYFNNKRPGIAQLDVKGVSPYHGRVVKNYTLNAATSEQVWAAGSYEVTEDMAFTTISMTGNVTLTIAEGVTLAASKGITIADGATLTVNGQGSLTVSNSTIAAAGANSSDNKLPGNGNEGYAGIAGNVIVNGGMVNVIGGTGGNGGSGFNTGGGGGIGGTGISGSLTVNGGTVNVKGGTGGKGGNVTSSGFGGTGPDMGQKGATGGVGISSVLTVNGGTVNVKGGAGGDSGHGNFLMNAGKGDFGKALGGTVICTASGHVIQERDAEETWSFLASGSDSDKTYIRVIPAVETVMAHQATFAGQTRYWATFYNSTDNYLLPSGAQAFTMGTDHVLYRVGDGSIVPSDCAVVIIADTADLTLTMTGSSATPEDGNILRGTDADTAVSSLDVPSGQNVYVMSKPSGGTFGFFQFTGTIPANKAYYFE